MRKYPWPASALTRENMATLHQVREQSCPRVPITRLIAQAIEQAYGQHEIETPLKRKEAA
jgi:hypothetical protein